MAANRGKGIPTFFRFRTNEYEGAKQKTYLSS